MKKILAASLILFFLAAVACGCSRSSSDNMGQELLSYARKMEQAGAYVTALDYYTQAQPVLRAEGNLALVAECRLAIKKLGNIVNDYSVSEETIRTTLLRYFPTITTSQMNFLLSRIAYLDIEGARYYYYDFMDTVIHLDLSLMQQLPSVMERNRLGYNVLEPYVSRPGPLSGSPYINSVTYQAIATYNIARNLLPAGGILQIWQPIAITTDCQSDVAIVSVSPASYVRNPATINGDLGDLYLEVPLASLAHAIAVEVKFQFKHFEQRFTMIDPANVGTYDKGSELYLKYTASGKNIFISPEIAAKARELVAGEQNPYYAAHKIYDYIVDELTYSHTPHGALASLNIPESVWVHEHRYGDCGAQSMYFAALCRSLGIPARTTGGYQLFPGMEGGHFWAEFYLPNYGWVPVDTSVAQICKYLPELTTAQKKAFKDYFFTNMDPFRWVIQKDVDLPFVPMPAEPPVLTMALQQPATLCDTMDEIPEVVIWPNYRISFSVITE